MTKMRHSFRFPYEVQDAVRRHVRNAVSKVDPSRYSQEPAYTSALMSALEGRAYEGSAGSVDFKATIATDHGPGAAERWSGIDFVITAAIFDQSTRVEKAIVFQAKRGNISALTAHERQRLIGQISAMKTYTSSPKVLEVPNIPVKMVPTVVSGNRVHSGSPYVQVDLADYFVRRVLPTLDGDTRPAFVQSVQESSLSQLFVVANLGTSR